MLAVFAVTVFTEWLFTHTVTVLARPGCCGSAAHPNTGNPADHDTATVTPPITNGRGFGAGGDHGFTRQRSGDQRSGFLDMAVNNKPPLDGVHAAFDELNGVRHAVVEYEQTVEARRDSLIERRTPRRLMLPGFEVVSSFQVSVSPPNASRRSLASRAPPSTA